MSNKARVAGYARLPWDSDARNIIPSNGFPIGDPFQGILLISTSTQGSDEYIATLGFDIDAFQAI
jgi:hypothetical protein